MKHSMLRRLASIGAVLALGVVSTPQLGATPQSSARGSAVATSQRSAHSAVEPARDTPQGGQGWGTMIACAGCVAGTVAIVAGGPAAIVVAVNMPGSAIAAMACTAVCYEAFR